MARELTQRTTRRVGASLLVLGMAAFAGGLLAGPAGAASVTPTVFEGEVNPDCESLDLDNQDSLKIDPWQTGDFDEGPVSITNATENSFDFSSTENVLAVIVKRSNSAAIYDYRPAGTTSDTDVTTVVKQAISHVTFCFGEGTQETTTTTEEETTTTTEAESTSTTGATSTTVGAQILPTSVVNPTTTAADPAPTTLAIEGTETERAVVQGETVARQELAATGVENRTLFFFAGIVFTVGGFALLFGPSPEPVARRS